jgi:hypothetical protein
MKDQTRRLKTLFWSLAALPVATNLAYAGAQAGALPFQYAGGTEKIEQNCAGNLEVTSDALVFKCATGSLTMPFSAITFMEYRPDLSRRVRQLKLNWSVRPDPGGGKRNRYFTVVSKAMDTTRVVVLKVTPLSMRPYLAEIELKSGKRVEVMGHEEYL